MAHENGAPDASSDTFPGDASPGSALPQRTPLAERIVALPPPQSMEAFRTKIKVKTPGNIQANITTSPSLANKATHGDDLTRIRGIDAPLAARLAAFGVSQYAQIATWDQTDVQNVSQVLDLGRTISRQNWIEQAALLARRGQDVQPMARRPLAGVPLVAMPLVIGTVSPPPEAAATPASASASVQALAASAVPPLSLPRVVSVDSPGDAKFHQAVVYVASAVDVVAQRGLTIGTLAPLWNPVIPVPEVPARRPPVALSAVDYAELLAPFQVPVPIVPVGTWSIVPQDVDNNELAQPLVLQTNGATTDTVGAAPSEVPDPANDASTPTSDDDTLASQLHAAVAAAADDRAVAATLDLLTAFSPPPVADAPSDALPHGWPPAIPSLGPDLTPDVSPDALAPDVLAPDAHATFARWVPPTPLLVPTPPSTSERASETWSPIPVATTTGAGSRFDQYASPQPAMMRAAAQAVATSAAAGPVMVPTVSAPAATVWARPRERRVVIDDMLPETTQLHVPVPSTVPVAPSEPPRAFAPLEPVAPTMLDRLASLEAELTALAANDQPRAHAAIAQAALPVAQMPLEPAGAPVLDLMPDVSRFAGRRAGVRLRTDLVTVPELPTPHPTGRDTLGGGEADVMILPRGSEQLDIRSIASGPSVGTLEQRMRRARLTPEVDVETYAGYHAAITEASVEIVRRDTQTRAVVFTDDGDGTDDGTSRGREGAVRKFFKALTGDAN